MNTAGRSAGSTDRRSWRSAIPARVAAMAWRDPASGVSFAYVMNQMNLSVMPGEKCADMVDALFSEM